jgi:hypothetical protein
MVLSLAVRCFIYVCFITRLSYARTDKRKLQTFQSDCSIDLVAYEHSEKCQLEEDDHTEHITTFNDALLTCRIGTTVGIACPYGNCTYNNMIWLEIWSGTYASTCFGEPAYMCTPAMGKCYWPNQTFGICSNYAGYVNASSPDSKYNPAGPHQVSTIDSAGHDPTKPMYERMLAPKAKSYAFRLKYPEGCKDYTKCYDSSGNEIQCDGPAVAASANEGLYTGGQIGGVASSTSSLAYGSRLQSVMPGLTLVLGFFIVTKTLATLTWLA